MMTARVSHTDNTLTELLGTFLQVSARHAPKSYSLRHVADRFQAWAYAQPVARLGQTYEFLVSGRLDPVWEELGLE